MNAHRSVARRKLRVHIDQIGNGGSGIDPLLCSEDTQVVIQFTDDPAHELPVGVKCVRIQHRMAGDFYCFIEGERQVSAVADSRVDALLSASRKLAA